MLHTHTPAAKYRIPVTVGEIVSSPVLTFFFIVSPQPGVGGVTTAKKGSFRNLSSRNFLRGIGWCLNPPSNTLL